MKRLTPELQGSVALCQIHVAVLHDRPRNVPSEGCTGCASVRHRSVSFHACGMVQKCIQNRIKYWRYIVRNPDRLCGLVRPSNLYHSWEQNPGRFISQPLSASLREVCRSLASSKEMVCSEKYL